VNGHGDQRANLTHFLYAHAASGNCRCPKAKTRRDHRRFCLERHGILIRRDVDFVESLLQHSACHACALKVDEEQMRIGTAGDELQTVIDECFAERFGIFDDVLLILLKGRFKRFLESDGLCRDDVHQGSSLNSGEYGRIDFSSVFFFTEDDAASRPAERLVRRRRHEVGIRDGIHMETRRDESGDVSHIDKEQCPDLIGDFTELRKIKLARVGARAGDDHLRLHFESALANILIINLLRIGHDLICFRMEILSGDVDFHTVRQVTAVRKVKTQDRIAGIEHREVDGKVRGRAGVRLHVGVFRTEQFFQVNKALVSRSTVFQMYPLTRDDILVIMRRAIEDKERGLGELNIKVDDKTLGMVADLSGGDARVALNGIELAAITTLPDDKGVITLTREIVLDSMQKKIARYDRDGEQHYDNISAMIKSIRGSDPDAAVLYLARALQGGEDLNFLGRRIVIAAAEDVGLANPQMLTIALSAWQASVMVGLPEARIILSEAVIALATSPKSNSAYLAIKEAMADVERRDTGEVPFHLRNAPVAGMEELGYAKGYEYSHDFPSAVSGQTFLPEESSDVLYYKAKDIGYEKRIIEWMNYVDSLRERLREQEK
jgi:putative ATPase